MREMELWRDKVTSNLTLQIRQLNMCFQIQLRIRDRIQTSVSLVTRVVSTATV